MDQGLRLGSIKIELAEGVSLLLWHDPEAEPETGYDILVSPGPPLQFCGKTHRGEAKSVPIVYSPSNPASGVQPLVLFENTGYHWKLRGDRARDLDPAGILSSLKPEGAGPRKADWTQTRLDGEAPGGFFKVVNYLGTAEMRIAPNLPALRFEIQSRKFDFHGEYSAMVEDIASRCQQLLLEWESPTSFNIAPDPERRGKLLLEQFLFLRHVLGGEKLDLYLEEIRRRPHVALAVEHEWKPASLARSRAFATDPVGRGRGWQKAPAGVFAVRGFSPGEILHERRYETFDTPPNRFIHFALSAFRDVCEEVMAAFTEQRGTAWLEAAQMRDTLDVFLAQPFFADVSRLERLPLENQTLQKREGYRDILLAWLMLETASRIDWPGREGAYDGTNRDAATLYEFWLYFILRDALITRLGMQEVRASKGGGEEGNHFLVASENGGLQINLAQGKESISRFRWISESGEELGVHLFYNRVFSPSGDPLGGGTYSRRFRPDYTVVFFPAEYLEAAKWSKAEQLAEEAGRIGYLHFDAKYRIEDLGKIFGGDADADLDREQSETKATDTYRRGDLYKMHAYNDAIRRTAGSYILYPGRDGEPLKDFPRYEEVVPGVGAFRLRPGDSERREKCEVALVRFVRDVLNHHVNTFSRDYRIRHWTHKTLQETPPSYGAKKKPQIRSAPPMSDSPCVLGYVRPDQEDFIRNKRRFYFYAVDKKDGATRNYDRPVFHAKFFIGRNRQKTLPWLAEVKSVKLESADHIAQLTGRDPSQVGAAFYYLMELGEPVECPQVSVSGLVEKRVGEPVILTLHEIFGLEREEDLPIA